MGEENKTGEEGTESGGGNSTTETKDDNKPELVSMPQDEMTRIMTREKQQGRDAGKKAVLKQLGVDTEEEALEILNAHREAAEAKKTEVDREKERLAREANEAKAERILAKKERLGARVESALQAEGVSTDVVSRAARLLEIEWDPEKDDVPDKEVIKGAVAELKKDMPQMFKEPGKTGPKDSDVGNGGGNNQSADTTSRVKDRLAKRHPNAVKDKKE